MAASGDVGRLSKGVSQTKRQNASKCLNFNRVKEKISMDHFSSNLEFPGLQLSRLGITVCHIELDSVSGNGLATNTISDVEEHFFAVLHVDETIALWTETFYSARVCSSPIDWTCEGLTPCRLSDTSATLDILGLHQRWQCSDTALPL